MVTVPKVSALKKYSVLFPYIVCGVSLITYIGQQAIGLALIPEEYQYIITAILAPLSAHLGKMIKQPNLPDSPYNPANQSTSEGDSSN